MLQAACMHIVTSNCGVQWSAGAMAFLYTLPESSLETNAAQICELWRIRDSLSEISVTNKREERVVWFQTLGRLSSFTKQVGHT